MKKSLKQKQNQTTVQQYLIRFPAGLVKYAPEEVYIKIQELLNKNQEEHPHLNLGGGTLVPLPKPGKLKCLHNLPTNS